MTKTSHIVNKLSSLFHTKQIDLDKFSVIYEDTIHNKEVIEQIINYIYITFRYTIVLVSTTKLSDEPSNYDTNMYYHKATFTTNP